ncbi:SWIRM domain-containing protein [Apiospora kogelbergensis]|uniref:SWIRM domain-containing protein n=1 Tax=Apiospora kogelbergensis TaxID=1337665 RepID=UPI00312FDD97
MILTNNRIADSGRFELGTGSELGIVGIVNYCLKVFTSIYSRPQKANFCHQRYRGRRQGEPSPKRPRHAVPKNENIGAVKGEALRRRILLQEGQKPHCYLAHHQLLRRLYLDLVSDLIDDLLGAFSALPRRRFDVFLVPSRRLIGDSSATFRRPSLSQDEEITSCVLRFGAPGFFSMLAYVAEHKPWIVVLENVLAAPFDLAKKQWFKPLGYTAWVGKLDTKDFYVPQTRPERKQPYTGKEPMNIQDQDQDNLRRQGKAQRFVNQFRKQLQLQKMGRVRLFQLSARAIIDNDRVKVLIMDAILSSMTKAEGLLVLAANLRLDCATYLTSKRRMFMKRLNCLRIGKDFGKTDTQQACKINVNKASKL